MKSYNIFIANLLTTICPSAVRVYFDKQIHPNALKNILGSNRAMLDDLLSRRIITPVQGTLLFPSGKDKKSVQLPSSPVWNTIEIILGCRALCLF
jgi:hypothetical protein